MVSKNKFPFRRFHGLTCCVLEILQSHTLSPRALFVSLITKCNLPYKYTKSSLWGSYVVRKAHVQVGCVEGLEAKSPRVFLNLRRSLEYKNLETCNRLSFDGNIGTVEKRRFSCWHNAGGFFCWGKILQSTYTNKRTVVFWTCTLDLSGFALEHLFSHVLVKSPSYTFFFHL